MDTLKIVLIEDDPMVREVNRQFIENVAGFIVVGQAANGVEGLQMIQELQPDLVFMDIFMPEQDGIKTLEKIRNENIEVDVITVTAANDMQTVQRILHLGVFDYIMKPFSFERVKHTLENYRNYKLKISSKSALTQGDLDELRSFNRQVAKQEKIENVSIFEDLPKGFNRNTLQKVLDYVKLQAEGVSAEDVASAVGIARVTARRYLDFLEKQKYIVMDVHYGGVGRPVNYYFSK